MSDEISEDKCQYLLLGFDGKFHATALQEKRGVLVDGVVAELLHVIVNSNLHRTLHQCIDLMI